LLESDTWTVAGTELYQKVKRIVFPALAVIVTGKLLPHCCPDPPVLQDKTTVCTHCGGALATAVTERAAPELVMSLAVAVIWAVPAVTAVASPPLLIVATLGELLPQVKFTPVKTFPLASFATALNCCVALTAREEDEGAIVMLATLEDVGVPGDDGGVLVEALDALPQPVRQVAARKKPKMALKPKAVLTRCPTASI
jgi:hypothetical protein